MMFFGIMGQIFLVMLCKNPFGVLQSEEKLLKIFGVLSPFLQKGAKWGLGQRPKVIVHILQHFLPKRGTYCIRTRGRIAWTD